MPCRMFSGGGEFVESWWVSGGGDIGRLCFLVTGWCVIDEVWVWAVCPSCCVKPVYRGGEYSISHGCERFHAR